MLKNNKGITLIALVITIIVLLILAGVSIAMLTGNNGILTRANDAKTKNTYGEAVDKIKKDILRNCSQIKILPYRIGYLISVFNRNTNK